MAYTPRVSYNFFSKLKDSLYSETKLSIKLAKGREEKGPHNLLRLRRRGKMEMKKGDRWIYGKKLVYKPAVWLR